MAPGSGTYDMCQQQALTTPTKAVTKGRSEIQILPKTDSWQEYRIAFCKSKLCAQLMTEHVLGMTVHSLTIAV